MPSEYRDLPHVRNIIDAGAFRLATGSDAEGLVALAREGFPEFAPRLASAIGSDWLGRIFVLDSGRDLEVLMLEPGTGEALEIPTSLSAFYRDELAEFADAALALEFLADWKAAGGAVPTPDQCVGYKVPLFLGGADATDNLELSNLAVYWGIMSQLRARTNPLPK